jgi:hypothetical protein
MPPKTGKKEAAAAKAAAAKAAPVQQAPAQETLEQQPLSGETETPRSAFGTFANTKFPTPDEIDAKMPKRMRDICNNWIVEAHQFDEMENAGGALMCARLLRAFLIFFIVTSSFGLCVGFIFKASLAAPMETEQYGEISAPGVVFCASPWGTDFLGFEIQAIKEGLVPGNSWHDIPATNWSIDPFVSAPPEMASALANCKYLNIKDVFLHPRGKVAQYAGFETIRMTINAQSEDGKFNFGFCNEDNLMPQRWSYAALGTRVTGEIKYDQVNVGASDVSEGTPRSILAFSTSGSISLGSTTELEYFFGYFMVRVLSAQAKGLTIFAVVAFVLLLAAAVNNCGLFELFFVEYVPDDEPAPSLVPNMVCQEICGKAFSSCRRRKQDPDEEAAADPA